ncbi:MAG: UDP-N-acetylglucosamine 2-epimerase [Cetobacterium sp.]
MIRKICVVTGTRAEYGLLKPLLKKLKDDSEIELSVIITGMHLSPEFGNTYKTIENDGFQNLEKVVMLLSSDSDIGIAKSMGLGMISYSETLSRISPDLLLVLGDRYETLSIVTVANVLKIPVAHLHGGEVTEGAFDDAFRHCISKMSYFHFTSTEEYRKRVIQLGEHPSRVFNVGAIGVENIAKLELISKEELKKDLGIEITDNLFVVLFHPVTLEKNSAEIQINELLNAVKETKIDAIFIKANSDSNGRVINSRLEEFVKRDSSKYKLFSSLTNHQYLSLIKHSRGLIGNSSSGIIEAPSFKVGNLNIGDRQRGRISAKSTLHCQPIKEEIILGIEKLKSIEFQNLVKNIQSPYGDGDVSSKIMAELKKIKEIDLKKSFYNLKF